MKRKHLFYSKINVNDYHEKRKTEIIFGQRNKQNECHAMKRRQQQTKRKKRRRLNAWIMNAVTHRRILIRGEVCFSIWNYQRSFIVRVGRRKRQNMRIMRRNDRKQFNSFSVLRKCLLFSRREFGLCAGPSDKIWTSEWTDNSRQNSQIWIFNAIVYWLNMRLPAFFISFVIRQ